jgi:5-methylcytosine-specific restriction protein A
MRSLPEWVGKTDDDQIPDRVRLRVFERYRGVCHLSGRKILPGESWDCDHIVALANGGEHRERNLAPALKDKHRGKTADDMAEKALVYRKRKKHLGIKSKKRSIAGRKFDGTPIPSRLR